MKLFLSAIALSAIFSIVNAEPAYYKPATNTLASPNESGDFYYPGGATNDFNWTVKNNAPNKIYGSFDTYSDYQDKLIPAVWNVLLLNPAEATPQERGPAISNGMGYYSNDWRADLIYNNERYVTTGNGLSRYSPWDVAEAFMCANANSNVSIAVNGDSNKLTTMNINPTGVYPCIANFVDMGPNGTFNYREGADYDFRWTVENDAPYPVTGSFDVEAHGLFASWNNITLDNKHVTQEERGPYFSSFTEINSNYWAVDLNYEGKRYFTSFGCNIQSSDLDKPAPTHVFVQGNENGLTDILIGRPSNWCGPFNFTYMGPVS